MELEIVFGKSSSKKYKMIVNTCRKFPFYFENELEHTLVIDYYVLKDYILQIEKVVRDIQSWKSTRFYLGGIKISSLQFHKALEIFFCSEKKCMNNEHCMQENGWGCRFLSSVSLRNNYSSIKGYWYDHGNVIGGQWTIDKPSLSAVLSEEAERELCYTCPFFVWEAIQEQVQKLPDNIIVDGTDECSWEWKYRDPPRGIKPYEIIGVTPKEEKGTFDFLWSYIKVLESSAPTDEYEMEILSLTKMLNGDSKKDIINYIKQHFENLV